MKPLFKLPKNFLKYTAGVLALSALLGAFNYFINPHKAQFGLAEDEVTADYVKSRPAGFKYLLIDARGGSDAKTPIKGAIRLAPETFDDDLGKVLDLWTPETTLIVFCDSAMCDTSRMIATRLKEECGLKNVLVFKDDWRKLK